MVIDFKKNWRINKQSLVYIIIGIIIVLLLILTLFPEVIKNLVGTSESDESPDKCKPEQGYNEESWREHMSHHPDIYKECLS